MADTPIPDQAVTVTDPAVEVLRDKLAEQFAFVVEDDDLPVLRDVLSAVLPHLTAAKPMHVEPAFVMGTKPDDSPWVISAEFAGADVRVDAYGVLRLHGKAVSPHEAHRLAVGLLSAIAWLENDGAAKTERAAALRGEQGE